MPHQIEELLAAKGKHIKYCFSIVKILFCYNKYFICKRLIFYLIRHSVHNYLRNPNNNYIYIKLSYPK